MPAEGGNTGYLRARMLCENEGSVALRGAPAGVSTQTLSRQLWKAMASGPSVATQNKPHPLPTCLVSDKEPGGGRARERECWMPPLGVGLLLVPIFIQHGWFIECPAVGPRERPGNTLQRGGRGCLEGACAVLGMLRMES